MADDQKNLPRLAVDEKWFPCHPGGEFGFLGERIYCDLTSSAGQPPKKLLCRYHWPQGKVPGNGGCGLEAEKVLDPTGLGLRSITVKAYQYAVPTPERKLRREERQFLQQDITGLITLRGAILKVVAEGSPRKVWHLFYSACKALNGYGKSSGGQRLVALQCPNSLGVDAKTGQVVMLDAEIKIPVLTDSQEAAFLKWFGKPGRPRYAQTNEASVLHSKALLLFFREVLGYLDKKEGGGGVAKQLAAQLDGLAKAGSLEELEHDAEAIAEDWSLPIDEMPVASVAPNTTSNPIPAARPVPQQERKPSWLVWFLCSLLANVLLVLLLCVLGNVMLFGTPKTVPGDKASPSEGGQKHQDAARGRGSVDAVFAVLRRLSGQRDEQRESAGRAETAIPGPRKGYRPQAR